MAVDQEVEMVEHWLLVEEDIAVVVHYLDILERMVEDNFQTEGLDYMYFEVVVLVPEVVDNLVVDLDFHIVQAAVAEQQLENFVEGH